MYQDDKNGEEDNTELDTSQSKYEYNTARQFENENYEGFVLCQVVVMWNLR